MLNHTGHGPLVPNQEGIMPKTQQVYFLSFISDEYPTKVGFKHNLLWNPLLLIILREMA
jgi:hypothetical protein